MAHNVFYDFDADAISMVYSLSILYTGTLKGDTQINKQTNDKNGKECPTMTNQKYKNKMKKKGRKMRGTTRKIAYQPYTNRTHTHVSYIDVSIDDIVVFLWLHLCNSNCVYGYGME